MPPQANAPAATPSRVVLVTGASSGIGLCSAALFARQGWQVGLVSRSPARLAEAAGVIARETPGARIAWQSADVTDTAALERAASAIVGELGPIDVWVNAAGNGVYGHFADVSEAEFQRVTDVTYLGTVNGTRIALSHMRPRDRGCIVNVCSAVVFHGVPLMSSYSGAKAAVRAFGQSLRLELRLTGSHIRLGTVFPPAINTPFFDHAVSHMGFPARPVPPVYGPAVAARGVYLCATGRGGEMMLTGVVHAYSRIARLSLGLAGYLVSKSDFAAHLPRDAEAAGAGRRVTPSLFDPDAGTCAIDGPFARNARGWSSQLGLVSAWRRLVRPVRRGVRSQPIPALATPGPAPGGSAGPGRAA